MPYFSYKAFAVVLVVSVVAALFAAGLNTPPPPRPQTLMTLTPERPAGAADANLNALRAPGAAAVPARAPSSARLSAFPTTAITRRDYDQVIHPIEGEQPKFLPGWTFCFDNVIQTPGGELIARITEGKSAAFKWETEKVLARKRGRYLVEATLPETRPGIVAAPLWLYSEGAKEGGHEFDFELMNGRIEYNLHNGNGGFNMRRVEKDLGGHRVRFEIIRRSNKVTMRIESLTDGFKDELVVTPKKVRKWAKSAGAPKGLRWPPNKTPMFPVMEFWVSNAPDWAGQWQPLPEGEHTDMVIHGYSFSAK